MPSKKILYIFGAGIFIVVIAVVAVYFGALKEVIVLGGKNPEAPAVLPKPLDAGEEPRLPVQSEIVPPEAEFPSGRGKDEASKPPDSEIIPPIPKKEEPKQSADTKLKDEEPVQEPPVPVVPEVPLISRPRPKLHIVSVEDGIFIPRNLTITIGDTIRWINNDTKLRWPSADPHPTHSALPEFDPLADLAPGESYTLTFTEVGVVPYHDHTQAIIDDVATITGTIIVVPSK